MLFDFPPCIQFDSEKSCKFLAPSSYTQSSSDRFTFGDRFILAFVLLNVLFIKGD